MGADRPHQECVAVRGCLRDQIGADIATRPAFVFDDDGLAQQFAELLRDGTAKNIRRTAWRIRDHQTERFAWVILRVGASGQAQERKG